MLLQVFLFGYLATTTTLAYPSRFLTPLIVGGEEARIEDHPYIMSLRLAGLHFCGSVILNQKYSLTAAHCTEGIDVSWFTLYTGSSDRTQGGIEIGVESYLLHPRYNWFTLDFDYCILRFKETLQFDDVRQPIRLPAQNERFLDGTRVVALGWGDTLNSNESPLILRSVEVPIFNQADCFNAFRGIGTVTLRMICAGYLEGGKDACQGDSGGPLAHYPTDSEPVLVGITSWGVGCALPGFPGVYARVPVVVDWITENIKIDDPEV